MARRRMISLDIIDTDKFLEMPVTSRCLYFEMLARADDDGFIGNPKRLMKMLNFAEDDLTILMMKGKTSVYRASDTMSDTVQYSLVKVSKGGGS